MQNTNILETLAGISDRVEPYIQELLVQDVEDSNKELALYQCSVGGKRLRPGLVVVSGQVFGAAEDDLLYAAAAAEILHNATLIIDDIIDHSEFRRDQPTCWNKFGKSIAECTAFAYSSSVFSGANRAKNGSKIVDLYGKTIKVIIDGEIKDILFERSGREDEEFVVQHRYREITKDDYFKMIGQKTAVLLQTCCMAGAICADASDEQVQAVGDFGYNLGMAFQLRDDILDIFGDEKEFGKKIGKDIIEKKLGNYIILSAIEQLGPEDKEYVRGLLAGNREVVDEDVASVTALIEKTNAKKDAEDTANYYIQSALRSLDQLPQNEHTIKLREAAEYIVGRNS
jgi:geranylgeranyl diphosphate synthase type I